MVDPRFYAPPMPRSLAELAALCGGELAVGADPLVRIGGVADLEAAGPEDLCFVERAQYLPRLAESRAGACLVRRKDAAGLTPPMPLVFVDQPQRAFALITQALYPEPAPRAGIAASASVAPDAQVAASAEIAAGAVIGAGAEIGARCRVGPYAVIGPGVVLGEECVIGPHASLAFCILGRGVRVLAGARIGEDGFGYVPGAQGHQRILHVGRVMIGDRVEIGANSTIDRGALGDTVIGAGTIIDNQVQIGHNVRIGENCILVAQSGVAGSTVLGDRVALGAKAGIAGHLTLGTGSNVAAAAGVMRDVEPGQTVAGAPAMPIRQFFRQQATLARMGRDRDS